MTTFQNYIQTALKQAEYHFDTETKQWIGEVTMLPVCWASGATVEFARDELAEVIEGYILLSLKNGDELPVLDEINLSEKVLSYA